MNGELKDGNMKEEAWQLCRDFLGGPWKDITLTAFQLYEVRGGLSNTLYRCALPEDFAKNNPAAPKQVLLRIYGPMQDDSNAVISESVTFMLLSERKLGPKLLGLFPKGRLEEFIPSHSLSSDEIRKYSPFIAREMAKIHALEIPVRKVADVWKSNLTKWLDEVQDVIRSDRENYFMSYNEFEKQIEWLSNEIEKMNSPVVYCHNDLQGGNILYREDFNTNGRPSLILIDFEFGCYNYRGFDIANHLCEWCFDYDTPEFPHFVQNSEKFPSKQEQIEFCSAYLDQIRKEGVQLKNTLKEETEKMVNEITLFACASHFMWSLWSIKMTMPLTESFGHKICDQKNCHENHNHKMGSTSVDDRHWKERMESTIIAALKEHSKTRRGLFQKFKEQYLASASKR